VRVGAEPVRRIAGQPRLTHEGDAGAQMICEIGAKDLEVERTGALDAGMGMGVDEPRQQPALTDELGIGHRVGRPPIAVGIQIDNLAVGQGATSNSQNSHQAKLGDACPLVDGQRRRITGCQLPPARRNVTNMVFDAAQVEQFITDGAVKLTGAFPSEVADECRALLWQATECAEHDPSTWTRPVIRIDYRDDAPFVAAAATPRLRAAFDQLAGPGRWTARRNLGTFPIRFPSPDDPGDAGWHIEASGYGADGRGRVDLASHARVLLMLFLFSEVGPDDAPTRVRLGSHRPAGALLAEAGPHGADFAEIAGRLVGPTAGLPEVAATGQPGDVWLCHPFLVHAAQPHHGTRPRFMAQPPLPGTGAIDPYRPAHLRSPVEEAVARALII
jgi:hypothetical protein